MTKLYIIENQDGNLKVGISNDPHKRLKQLQTGHATKLTIVKTYNFDTRKKAVDFEKRCHLILKRFSTHGEWFALETSVAVKTIDELYSPTPIVDNKPELLMEARQKLEQNTSEGTRLRKEIAELKSQLNEKLLAFEKNLSEYATLNETVEYLKIFVNEVK